MTTLTDRYIAAVTRGIPSAQRPDLDRELRALLADAIEDRVEAGLAVADAEYAAIAELGDPMVLASTYRGRPLQLIGPALYPTWTRLIVLLEAIVVPIVLVTIVIVWLFRGEGIGEAIGAGFWIALETGVHLAFWTTLLFAIVERTDSARATAVPWTPDALADSTTDASGPTTLADLLWTAAFASVIVAVFTVSWFVSPFADATGAPITLLDPWMLQTGLAIAIIAVPVLGTCFAVAHHAERGGRALSVVAFLVDVIGGVALIIVGLSGHVLNPAFVEAASWAELVTPIVNYSIAGLGALLILASASANLRRTTPA